MRPLALKLVLDGVDQFAAAEKPTIPTGDPATDGEMARLTELVARARIELAGLTPASRLDRPHKVLNDALQLLGQARYRLAHAQLPDGVPEAAWLRLLSRIQSIEGEIVELVEHGGGEQ